MGRGHTLRIVTPEPVNDVSRSEALNAAQCTFREAGAPNLLIDRLGVPASGEQSSSWTDFTGAWSPTTNSGRKTPRLGREL